MVKGRVQKVSYKNNDGAYSHDQQEQQREGDILAASPLLVVIGLADILTRSIDIAISGEHLLPDDVQLIALLIHQHSRLLDDVMHVHDASGHDVDLLIALMHQLPLHFEFDFLFLLLLVGRILMSGLALLVGKPAPGGQVASRGLRLGDYRLHRGQLVVGRLIPFGGWGLFIVGGEEQLVSAVPLDSKLLLGCANFAGRIGVQIRLLELLNEAIDAGCCILDNRLLSFESGRDDGARIDPNSSVEMVVAILELLDE